MKYCTHCGNELLDEAVVCPKCGCSCGKVNNKVQAIDDGERWPQVLSFFFPIVGLIFFLVYMDDNPIRSKKCGKWALIGLLSGVIIGVVVSIIIIIAFSLLAVAGMGFYAVALLI